MYTFSFSSFLAQGNPIEGTGQAITKGVGGVKNILDSLTGSMGGQVGEFLPKLLGAAMVLIVGWIIARIVKWVLSKVIRRTGIGTRLANFTGKGDGNGIASGTATAGFWTVMLFVAIAALNTLGLEQVGAPLTDLLTKFFAFLPNVIGAGAMLAVAWLIATLAKFGVGKGLEVSDLDTRLKLQPGTLTNSLPMAAFCFILLFFLPGVLGALKMPALSGPIEDLVRDILGFLPNLLSAGLIVGITYFIAQLLGTLVTNLLSGVGFNELPQKLGLVSNSATMATEPSALAGKASFFVVLMLGISQAVETLKLTMVSNFFKEGWEFAVPVLVGIVMLAVGLWLANLAKSAIMASSMPNSATVANIAWTAILVLSGVVSLKKMGLADGIIEPAFIAIIAGLALAAALAFGLGGREAAAKFLDKRVK